MGRTSDEEGESSTQGCDLEDSDERPLKKARYIWQIKGKYHLKKSDDEEKDRAKHSLPDSSSPVEEIDGFATLTSEVECSKTHLGEDKKEPVTTPIVVESAQKTEEESEVVSLGTTYEVQELADAFSTWELRKWQDRQLARSFVDNTVNSVIEIIGFVPLPFDADDISDEEFSMPENDDDDDVEDEAVLMAIHSHGLQRSEQEKQAPQLERCCIENKMSIVPCICNQKASGSLENQTPYPFHQRPVLSHIVDPDPPCETSPSQNQEAVLPVSTTNSVLNIYPASAVVCNHFDNSKNEASEKVLLKRPLETSLDRNTQPKSDVLNSTGTQLQPTKDDKNSSYFEHNDFLDQAVGVAIQKKGLSTLSCLEFG